VAAILACTHIVEVLHQTRHGGIVPRSTCSNMCNMKCLKSGVADSFHCSNMQNWNMTGWLLQCARVHQYLPTCQLHRQRAAPLQLCSCHILIYCYVTHSHLHVVR
jgi:hypothetical protein